MTLPTSQSGNSGSKNGPSLYILVPDNSWVSVFIPESEETKELGYQEIGAKKRQMPRNPWVSEAFFLEVLVMRKSDFRKLAKIEM